MNITQTIAWHLALPAFQNQINSIVAATRDPKLRAVEERVLLQIKKNYDELKESIRIQVQKDEKLASKLTEYSESTDRAIAYLASVVKEVIDEERQARIDQAARLASAGKKASDYSDEELERGAFKAFSVKDEYVPPTQEEVTPSNPNAWNWLKRLW